MATSLLKHSIQQASAPQAVAVGAAEEEAALEVEEGVVVAVAVEVVGAPGVPKLSNQLHRFENSPTWNRPGYMLLGQPIQRRNPPSLLKMAASRRAMNPLILSRRPERKALPNSLSKKHDDDLPPPFASTNGSFEDTDIEDQADLIMRQRFQPMTDPQKFIAALTKHAPAERTTEILYAIAENTQRALQEWQDEYLEIDKRVAAHANNGPRKPVTGGRVPVDPKVFEDMKEADLYSYTYDHRKAPGKQDPWNQRVGTDEEEASGKRRRKAVQRFDAMPDAASLARKRDVAASETPEPQALPRKKGKLGSGKKIGQFVPQRIQEIARDESVMTTSASEEDDGDIYEAAPEPVYKRRGRPPGSKNHNQRKDAGIKKGPRTKKTTDTAQGAQDSDRIPGYTTMPSATPPAIAPAYQQPAQNQPFHVQGYTHAPPTNIPPAPLAPVMNIDRSFAIANRPPIMHPFTPPTPPPQMDYPVASYQQIPTTTSMIQPTATTPIPLAPSPTSGSRPSPTSRPSSAGKKKPVKSEKRSASMTQWWADRKAKQAEERQREVARSQATVVHHPGQMAGGSAYGNANGYTGPYPQPGYAPGPFTSAQPAQNAYRPIAPSGLHQNHASPHLQPQPLQHHQHHMPQQHQHHHQHPPPLPHPSQAPNHNAGEDFFLQNSRKEWQNFKDRMAVADAEGKS
ncbi:hypothetical protein K490DRAFT_54332 [Saccharata proteae CBS 121410]|uniref:Uncharacterized protein n=1 Tax=Saccharata proteae CBS 121410 TaxID=1314787 RepID=A0A9P4HVH2_9PEZI|nr:hypothetical protein K490DRAFT_54332 [Saccharata proteae CBS 121410]